MQNCCRKNLEAIANQHTLNIVEGTCPLMLSVQSKRQACAWRWNGRRVMTKRIRERVLAPRTKLIFPVKSIHKRKVSFSATKKCQWQFWADLGPKLILLPSPKRIWDSRKNERPFGVAWFRESLSKAANPSQNVWWNGGGSYLGWIQRSSQMRLDLRHRLTATAQFRSCPVTRNEDKYVLRFIRLEITWMYGIQRRNKLTHW